MKLITEELLINLAGQAAFERGKKLFEQGKVRSIEPFKNHILATVQGTQLYAINISHTASIFEGSCNCPASDNIDFCKHCVAVGLHIMAGSNPETTSKADKQTKVTAKEKQLQTISQYFNSLTKPDLEKALLEYIEHQPDLRVMWLAKAETALGLIDFKTLRKKMTAAIPYNRDLYYYDQVRNYFEKVDQLVQQIKDNQLSLTEEELFKLGEYGLQRLERALESIDDSGGFRFPSLGYFETLVLDGFLEIDWKPKQKTDWLLNAILKKSDIKPDYSNLLLSLSVSEQADLISQAEALWHKLPNQIGFSYDYEHDIYSLQSLLVKHAETQKNWTQIVDYYEKTDTCFNTQCLQLKREIDYALFSQAETRLEKLKQQAKSKYDQSSLYPHEIELAKQLNQPQRQSQAQWHLYQVTGDIEVLETLLSWENNPQQKALWLKQAEDFFEAKLDPNKGYAWNDSPPEYLVDLYLYQDKNEQAYDIIANYETSRHVWKKLADHPKTPFKLTWHIYRRLIETELDMTNNKAYKKGLGLIKEVASKTQHALDEQYLKNQLAELRTDYQRKINFTKWFDELLPKLFKQ
ncbi:SWIM zinc finger domain-containing protein [Thiomicrorhabdus sp. Milos-T2]|uniref:SWIM zinc finger family protein n=1 Tax=Thiomicrorhabdus sp. Milos-T2 TaxID=90814 RepID=UPI00049454CD|nr:hypothetical protein [Thiomicrorhabdus sp. Milos-T2]